MPGMPALLIRLVHAMPVLHVPLLPDPQQGWPAPPQVPHWFPVGDTRQLRPDPHGSVAPPSDGAPPAEEQHG
jgi:hypothetical protein